jgi:hypothetical protein
MIRSSASMNTMTLWLAILRTIVMAGEEDPYGIVSMLEEACPITMDEDQTLVILMYITP